MSDVTIQGNTINGHFNDGRAFSTYAPNDPGIVTGCEEVVSGYLQLPKKKACQDCWEFLFPGFLCSFSLGFGYFMRQMQGGGGKAMGFGKSKRNYFRRSWGALHSTMWPASMRQRRNWKKLLSS